MEWWRCQWRLPTSRSPTSPGADFQPLHEESKRQRDHQIAETSDYKWGEIGVGAGQIAPVLGQLVAGRRQAQDVGKRRVLYQQDQLIGQWRNDDPKRLRKHDLPTRHPGRHTERASRLDLALRNCLDAGSDGLGHVGGSDYAERKPHGAVRVEGNNQAGKGQWQQTERE